MVVNGTAALITGKDGVVRDKVCACLVCLSQLMNVSLLHIHLSPESEPLLCMSENCFNCKPQIFINPGTDIFSNHSLAVNPLT